MREALGVYCSSFHAKTSSMRITTKDWTFTLRSGEGSMRA